MIEEIRYGCKRIAVNENVTAVWKIPLAARTPEETARSLLSQRAKMPRRRLR
jgi:hypothetical protein